jgi:ribosome-binding protein aMBF1 (putative translation factor)
MKTLDRYIKTRKIKDQKFAKNYDKNYIDFKIGVILRNARQEAGLTQEDLARRVMTKKTAISRLENHADDIRLSTLQRVAEALGKHVEISIV